VGMEIFPCLLYQGILSRGITMTNTLGHAKITRGGQVTLNKKIREELGLNIGSYVIFQKEGNKLVVLPAELKLKTSS